jgi:hypothetical protein
MRSVNPYEPHLGGDINASIILMLLTLSAAIVVGILYFAAP